MKQTISGKSRGIDGILDWEKKGKKSDQTGKDFEFPEMTPRSRSVQMQIATDTRYRRISIEVHDRANEGSDLMAN